MEHFKNIPALYGRQVGEEAALDRAVALAKRNQARLTVAEAAFAKLPDGRLEALMKPDVMASNGMIHVIDKDISPN